MTEQLPVRVHSDMHGFTCELSPVGGLDTWALGLVGCLGSFWQLVGTFAVLVWSATVWMSFAAWMLAVLLLLGSWVGITLAYVFALAVLSQRRLWVQVGLHELRWTWEWGSSWQFPMHDLVAVQATRTGDLGLVLRDNKVWPLRARGVPEGELRALAFWMDQVVRQHAQVASPEPVPEALLRLRGGELASQAPTAPSSARRSRASPKQGRKA